MEFKPLNFFIEVLFLFIIIILLALPFISRNNFGTERSLYTRKAEYHGGHKSFLEETGSRSQSDDRRPFYAPRGYLRARTYLRSAARNDN